ncbi:phage integrase family protein [Alcanivorax hongdengensis A-11-3]|uniref:Phage integrase family protein n=1 Tax=Alcanivorax hongdengensis A-11-3 TaxID=1177179 RepID=L0WB57_9GAMM|nr:tyrosine-type recombinase/integrase [Alcanivorax hongdengensis]EKF74206.1 phage integrase family protein [Alcanivorax hongdengensis A-11-3]
MIKPLPDGRWHVDIEPVKGQRHRKTLATKAEAKRFESLMRVKYLKNPEWNQSAKDKRHLEDLINRWFLLHGQTLSDGLRRKQSMLGVCSRLGNPVAARLSGQVYTEFRSNALSAGSAGKTLNNQLGYLRAMYNELARLGEITYPNPLSSVRMLKLQERELSYLTTEQIPQLFKSIRNTCELPHAELVAIICLSTGCRWGEARSLTPDRVKSGQVTFVNTKSKRARSVPISKELSARIHRHFNAYGLFTRCEPAFDKALKRSGIKLPRGQSTHVLRHTFASHFMMNGGNILTLQKILGHATVTMTMRYAHLAPDHLREAIGLGPLTGNVLADIFSTD